MRYSDVKLLDDMHFFDGKDVYIYGTGDYGFRAARMLDKIGVFDYTFCNSDRAKEGTKKLGNRIIHPSNIRTEPAVWRSSRSLLRTSST